MVLRLLDPSVEMGDYLLAYTERSDGLPTGVELSLMFQVAGVIEDMGTSATARPDPAV